MRAAPFVATIAVALFTTGCLKPRPAWRELQFTRTKPSESDIVGAWRPTTETLHDNRSRGHYSTGQPELILRADHSFDMRDMPDWWLDGFGHSHGKLQSGSGRWELASADNIWQVWVVRLRFPAFETSVHLYHQRTPFLLFVRVGDPDVGDAMFFERSKT